MTALAAAAAAQPNVSGIVTDPLGRQVADARVAIERGARLMDTKTNVDGEFSVAIGSAGRIRITAEAPGFVPYAGPELFVGAGGLAGVRILLQIAPLKQEVVVSATGSELPVSQVGASVALIDGEEIRAENKLDLLENLRQFAGAQVVQVGQRGGTTSLLVRGGEATFNKIMIDGSPANAIGGGFDFAQLATSGIESVELLKGPNSVLFGADALAGVVNVTTRRGTSSTPELAYAVDGGNFGTLRQAASLGGMLRAVDYFTEFSRFDTRGSYPNSYFHNATYAANVGWAASAATRLRATYRRNWTDLGAPNGLLLYGIADDSSQKNQNTYLSGTVDHQTSYRWHNRARFAFAQFASAYANPTATGDPDPYGFGNYLGREVELVGANGYRTRGQAILDYWAMYPQRTLSYEARRSAYAQSDYRVTRDWTATAGFRYEHENGAGLTRDNFSYFAESHGMVGHRLYATAGVGLEDNAVFGFAASPRASLAYYVRQPSGGEFFSETKLRFNFGLGIKEPGTYQQASQLYALLTPAQREAYRVGSVGPERSRAFDFGVQQGIWQGRGRLDVTYFQNRFYDLITYLDPTALIAVGVDPEAAKASGFGAYVNASSTRSKGVEAQFAFEPARGVRVRASYTFLDAVVTKAFGAPMFNPAFPGIPIGAYSPLENQRPFRRAPHSGSVSVLYARRKFTAAFMGYFVGRRDESTFLSDALFGGSMLLPNRNLAPGYQKLDLSGGYQIRPWVSVYTAMENLLSQRAQPAFGFPSLPFTIRTGLALRIGGAR